MSGKELDYIAQSISFGNIRANGRFTKATNELLYERFNLGSSLMVTSCTSALEMAAILCDVESGDEVLLPSCTFISTANASVRVGVTTAYVDVRPDTLNRYEAQIENAITPLTKASVPVRYAGVACEMDTITDIAERHGIYVVEDAAQGMRAYYRGRALGSIGHMTAYSYHETKNYVCGEGGTLTMNHPELQTRAEIIRDHDTNRQQLFRGSVEKYTWVDIGSSYVLSLLFCAFLYAQLETLDEIRALRKQVFDNYQHLLGGLEDEGFLQMPVIPDECETNYHMFYILHKDQETRDALMQYLREHDINAVFHYIPLHTSPMGRSFGYSEGQLPVTEDLSGRLLRLPFFNEISFSQQERITDWINSFLAQRTYRMAA